jgi:hypothetical protein
MCLCRLRVESRRSSAARPGQVPKSRWTCAAARHTGGVERWEREEILGEWGVRDPSPIESNAARRLDEDLDGSPLRGRPLPRRLRNFRPAVEGYLTSQGGPLPYMQRLREIESATDEHLTRLERVWSMLADQFRGTPDEFGRRWRSLAHRWNFTEVNDLIERHNRWFPIEARLAMDPRTGDFVHVDGKPYRRQPLDADWVLERYPPALPAAA